VLLPVSVMVPVPTLVKLPVPEMVPEKVVLVLLLPEEDWGRWPR
jgi:hypothetical protein